MSTASGIVFTVILAVLAYVSEVLDYYGVIVALFMGAIVSIFGGLEWLLLLLSFVLIGYISTKFEIDKKREIGVSENRNGRRRIENVIANGIVPVSVVVLGWVYLSFLNHHYQTGLHEIRFNYNIFIGAYIGSIATATSDTVASELGSLDSETRLITNIRRKVSPGTDGGISFVGEIGSLIGGLIIGLVAFAIFNDEFLLVVAPISGFIGCHVDSLLGATLERRDIINNEYVNLFSTLVGAISGGLLIFLSI